MNRKINLRQKGTGKMEKVFVDGMIVKRPHENAPDFVKCSISFKVDEMVAFLNKHESDGWVNADMKVSKGGNLYAELNTYKKKRTDEPPVSPPPDVETNNADHYDNDIPF